MSDHRNSAYLRRRRAAEEKIAAENLMPDDPFVVGSVRVALYEKLVTEHMTAEQPLTLEDDKPPTPHPTAAQVARAVGSPTPMRDTVARQQAMADAIGDEMAAARGETAA